jgi:cytochrome b pre-mRNA-processing protein 3
MLSRLFRSRPQRAKGAALYLVAVAQARQAEFYAGLGVPDRIDARFELYSFHVLLLILRLKGAGEEGSEVSQALFDSYLSALDDTLRELGVGDLSVAKKMRRLAETIYARIRAFEAATAEDAEPNLLDDLVARALFPQAPPSEAQPAPAAAVADYLRRALATLQSQPARDVLDGKPQWPPIIP